MPLPPAGISPASDPVTSTIGAQSPAPAILADRIDPETGDFESLFTGRPLADAFALEALTVQRGTGAAVRDLGNRFRELTHVEAGTAELIEGMAQEAFADAERAGVAQLTRVSVTEDPSDGSQLDTVLEYRDLLAPPESAARRLVFPR